MKGLALLVVLAVVASACSAATPSAAPSSPPSEAMQLAAVDVPRIAGTAAEAEAAADASNAFGFDAYRALVAADPDAGIVMSPASIALALAMARAGARGTTAEEMDDVLRDLGTDEHAASIAALDAALGDRTHVFQDATGEPQPVTLRVVNAPFAQRGLRLEQAYLEALGGRFGAGLRLVDYIGAAEAARNEINDWVAGETEQRIDELLAPGVMDDLTRLVLVNAIYLKAAWLVPFDKASTREEPFERLDGSTVDVTMMHAGASMPYAEGAGWRAVEIPYVGNELAMVVIVPDDLVAFETALDSATFGSVINGLASRRVELGLPRFGLETQAELGSVLAGLGMPTAFTPEADFSGITTEVPLEISEVVHQATIDVDEEGTEAAAATAVVMRESAAPVADVALTVDRPYLFALRDRSTGAILFFGRVTEPAERDT